MDAIKNSALVTNEIRSVFYKDQEIIVIDFSEVGADKEKALAIIAEVFPTLSSYPKNSVLTLTNVSGLRFDKEVLEAFKESILQVRPYQRKAAVIGMKGIQKAAYTFVTMLTMDITRSFDSELEAKEWLVS
jgi:hypothetical protein